MLREIGRYLGLGPKPATTFSGDNGEELLRRHFARVEARDARGTIHFPDRTAVNAYFEASPSFLGGGKLPEFEGPFDVRSHPVVFVAEKLP